MSAAPSGVATVHEARGYDAVMDEYDEPVADSFPASDPPVQP